MQFNYIHSCGDTDLFSQSELEHRSVKRYYTHINKINTARDIARVERRERLVRKARLQQEYARLVRKRKNPPKKNPAEGHHFISSSRNEPLPLGYWISSQPDTPMWKVSSQLRILQSVIFVSYSNFSRTSFRSSEITSLVVFETQGWQTMALSTPTWISVTFSS